MPKPEFFLVPKGMARSQPLDHAIFKLGSVEEARSLQGFILARSSIALTIYNAFGRAVVGQDA